MTPAHERFARWCKWLGVSQEAVAKKLGCTQGMVSYLLRGERQPGLGLALAIQREMKLARRGKRFPGGPIDPSHWLPRGGKRATGPSGAAA
jgi:transcriptional regulator with XRE-family HTH domain